MTSPTRRTKTSTHTTKYVEVLPAYEDRPFETSSFKNTRSRSEDTINEDVLVDRTFEDSRVSRGLHYRTCMRLDGVMDMSRVNMEIFAENPHVP